MHSRGAEIHRQSPRAGDWLPQEINWTTSITTLLQCMKRTMTHETILNHRWFKNRRWIYNSQAPISRVCYFSFFKSTPIILSTHQILIQRLPSPDRSLSHLRRYESSPESTECWVQVCSYSIFEWKGPPKIGNNPLITRVKYQTSTH